MQSTGYRVTFDLLYAFPQILADLFRHMVSAALKHDFFEAETLGWQLMEIYEGPYGNSPALRDLIRGFLNNLFGYYPFHHHEQQLWRAVAERVAGKPWPADSLRRAVQAIPAPEWERYREQRQTQAFATAATLLAGALILAGRERLEQAAITALEARQKAIEEDHFLLWFDTHVRLLPHLFEGFPTGHPDRLEWETAPDGKANVPWPRPFIREKLREYFPYLLDGDSDPDDDPNHDLGA